MLSNNALFILGHTVFFACFVCSLAQESYIFPMTAYGEMEYKRTACETRVIAKTHRSRAFLRVMQLPFPTLLQDVSRSPLRCEKAPRRRVGLQLLVLRELGHRHAISASTVQSCIAFVARAMFLWCSGSWNMTGPYADVLHWLRMT